METNSTPNKKQPRPIRSCGDRIVKWFMGLFLIALGVLMVLRNQGVIDARPSQLLLPMLALGMGIGLLIDRKRHYVIGILLVAGGLYFLLPRLMPYPFWLPVWPAGLTFWPIVCIVLGLIMLTHLIRPRGYSCKTSCRSKDFDQPATGSNDGFIEVDNSFGAVRHIVLDPVFKGARIRTRCSGTVLDLKRTTLAEGETYIDVDMALSGLELHVPENWTVVVEQLSVSLGGVDEKRYYSAAADSSRKLVLRGSLTLSGIEIDN